LLQVEHLAKYTQDLDKGILLKCAEAFHKSFAINGSYLVNDYKSVLSGKLAGDPERGRSPCRGQRRNDHGS